MGADDCMKPYLLSLGMSKSFLALVWIAGPLTGTLVQPYIGIRSDNCRISWGKRKPFMIIGALATMVSLLCLAWAREIVGGFLTIFGVDRASFGVKIVSIMFAIMFIYILDVAINTGTLFPLLLLTNVDSTYLLLQFKPVFVLSSWITLRPISKKPRTPGLAELLALAASLAICQAMSTFQSCQGAILGIRNSKSFASLLPWFWGSQSPYRAATSGSAILDWKDLLKKRPLMGS